MAGRSYRGRMTFTVPGYRIEGLLGHGGQGQVWAARSLVDGDRVALKRIPAGSADAIRAARSEAALLAALDHPNLISLRGFLVVRTDVVLVLELAGAGSLAALLGRRQRLAPAEVVATISPVAAALAHAHASGILHGDVSAANVLFTDTGRPKLADLGVARLLAVDGPATGTPAYLDPVLAAGGAAGPASDVFALAAVALHALTGAGPWQRAGQLAVAEQVLAVAATGQVVGLADRLAGLPPAVAAVLARTLDPDPHQRGTAAEFALELRAALPPEPVRLTDRSRAGIGRPAGGGHQAGQARSAGLGRARMVSTRRSATVGRHSAQWSAANRTGSAGGIDQPGSDDNPARLAADLTQVSIRSRPGVAPVAEAGPGHRSRLASLGSRRWRIPIVAGTVSMLVATGALTLGRSHRDAGSAALTTSLRATSTASTASTARPASSASPIDPAAILVRLDRLRSAAYAQRRPELLEQVYRSTSLLAADTAQLLRSVPAGCRLTGLDTDYRQLQASSTAGRLQIRTLASLPAGALACAGTVRGHTPAVGPVRLELTLSDAGSGYLLDGERLLDTAP
jgi:serine/threonine protein kinase